VITAALAGDLRRSLHTPTAYREISLLLLRPAPGARAYPRRVSYLHSAVTARALPPSERCKGGGFRSPLCPSSRRQARRRLRYIPTTWISRSPRQIYSRDRILFHSGRFFPRSICRRSVPALSAARAQDSSDAACSRHAQAGPGASTASWHPSAQFSQRSSKVNAERSFFF